MYNFSDWAREVTNSTTEGRAQGGRGKVLEITAIGDVDYVVQHTTEPPVT